jgi:hypothetical protein
MNADTVIEARKKAERAVADMPDGDLKLKAFELILNRLLSAAEEGSPAPKGSKRNRSKRRGEEKPSAEKKKEAVPVSTPARILELKAEGFFTEQRGIGDIRDELQTHGWRYDVTALSGTLMKLVRARELRRAKVNDGNKTAYRYFNP